MRNERTVPRSLITDFATLSKKHVERTSKELVAEVYPADKPYLDVEDKKGVKRGKKYYEAAEHILNALVAGSTTLVSDISLSLADNAFEDEAEMQRIAILAYPPPQAPEGIARWGAQAYRNRWQIERSFEAVKQEFSLEKLRVRTFRRLKNVFSLCVVAYLFVTRYLRASSCFRGIVKAIRDNCTEQSMTTHPLLANLRSLIGEERIRNITGRPRKPPEKEPDQLEFAFPDAA